MNMSDGKVMVHCPRRTGKSWFPFYPFQREFHGRIMHWIISPFDGELGPYPTLQAAVNVIDILKGRQDGKVSGTAHEVDTYDADSTFGES